MEFRASSVWSRGGAQTFMVAVLPLALVAVAGGLLATSGDTSRPLLVWLLVPVAAGLAGLVLGQVLLVRFQRSVTIAPEGLRLRRAYSERRYAWSDLGEVRVAIGRHRAGERVRVGVGDAELEVLGLRPGSGASIAHMLGQYGAYVRLDG